MSKAPFFRMMRHGKDEQDNPKAYYSCSEIEGALTFIHSGLAMCGHMHSKDKGMPYIAHYQGGEIPVKEIISEREKLRIKNQSLIDTPCKGCQFLQKREWPRNPYLINHITVGHYSLCNLGCSYCYITDYTYEQKKKYFTQPYNAATSLEQLFGANLVAPDATAWLTAGEPTLFADFQDVMHILLKHQVRTTIGTNCTKAYPIIEQGLRDDLVEVLCSVDAGTPAKYKEIKGKDRHQAVWDTLAAYIKANPANVVVKYIFMDENCSIEEVEAFIGCCVAAKIRKISISRDILKYRGVLSEDQQPLPKPMLESMSFMMSEAQRNGLEVFFDINWPVFADDEIQDISSGASRLLAVNRA